MDQVKRANSQPSAKIPATPDAPPRVLHPFTDKGRIHAALQGLGWLKSRPNETAETSEIVEPAGTAIPEEYNGRDGILRAVRKNDLKALSALLNTKSRIIDANYRDPKTGETAWGVATYRDDQQMKVLLKPALDAAPRGLKPISEASPAETNAAATPALTVESVKASEYCHANYYADFHEGLLPEKGMYLFANHDGNSFKFVYRSQHDYVSELKVFRGQGSKIIVKSTVGSLQMEDIKHLMDKALENTTQRGVPGPKIDTSLRNSSGDDTGDEDWDE
jgi:hypothetical protein